MPTHPAITTASPLPAFVLSLAFAFSPDGLGAQTPQSSAAIELCPTIAEVTSIESTASGLLIRTTRGLDARIVATASFAEKGLAGFAMLTVDLPGATFGAVSPRAEWTSGLFSSMRAVRYRGAADCGLRLRLQPNVLAEWTVERQPDGIVITPRAMPVRSSANGSPKEAPRAGSFYAGASHSLTLLDRGDTVSFTQLQLGLSQQAGRFGLIRGFLSAFSPRGATGAPYAAVSLSGFMLGRTATHIAAGDISVGQGDLGIAESTLINTLLIRGGGASLFLPRGTGLQFFGGRASSPTITRIPGTLSRVTQEISHDKVFGGQLTWSDPTRAFGAGAGILRSLPVDGRSWWNAFESVEASVRRTAVRLTVEQSREDDGARTGFALTAEPHAATGTVNAGGYYRYVSSEFQPPAGATFFAGLRRSYSLYGSVRPRPRITASASLGQTRTFSIFDRPDVGTLSSTHGFTLSYQMTRTISASAEYAESEVRTEAGALLPANSFTARRSLATSARLADLLATLRLSREETTNRLGRQLSLESNRADLDLSRPIEHDWGEIYSHMRYADSRRPNGAPAGSNYAASLGFRSPAEVRGGLRGEIGYSITPAGIAGRGFRQAFATLGVQSGRAWLFHGGAQLTYERFYIAGEPARNAAVFSINASRLLEWGGRPAPPAPFFTRAMPLIDRALYTMIGSRLIIHTYEDRNSNGVRDLDEPAVPNAPLRVDGLPITTDDQGRGEASVPSGFATVGVDRASPLLDEIAQSAVQTVQVPPIGSATVDVAFVPAGRLAGRVRFEGDSPEPGVLAGIRITLRGGNIDRETVTDNAGAFRFGVLPVDRYTMTLDASTLAAGTILAGPASITIDVMKGERSDAVFSIRRATARERIIGVAGKDKDKG